MEKKVYIKFLIFLVAINTCVNKCIVVFHILEKDSNFFLLVKKRLLTLRVVFYFLSLRTSQFRGGPIRGLIGGEIQKVLSNLSTGCDICSSLS